MTTVRIESPTDSVETELTTGTLFEADSAANCIINDPSVLVVRWENMAVGSAHRLLKLSGQWDVVQLLYYNKLTGLLTSFITVSPSV